MNASRCVVAGVGMAILSFLFPASAHQLLTPKGSNVSHYHYEEFSEATVAAMDAEIAEKYPYAVKWRSASAIYNCHSYAWADENCWVPDPWIYVSDGSSSSDPSGPMRTWGDVASHSAIHSAIKSSGTICGYGTCVSKWGAYGLYKHADAAGHHPYGGSHTHSYTVPNP